MTDLVQIASASTFHVLALVWNLATALCLSASLCRKGRWRGRWQGTRLCVDACLSVVVCWRAAASVSVGFLVRTSFASVGGNP